MTGIPVSSNKLRASKIGFCTVNLLAYWQVIFKVLRVFYLKSEIVAPENLVFCLFSTKTKFGLGWGSVFHLGSYRRWLRHHNLHFY